MPCHSAEWGLRDGTGHHDPGAEGRPRKPADGLQLAPPGADELALRRDRRQHGEVLPGEAWPVEVPDDLSVGRAKPALVVGGAVHGQAVRWSDRPSRTVEGAEPP